MAENKTQETHKNVERFIANVENETRRKDAEILLKMMESITGCKPALWGPSIIGYGNYRLKYDSGRELDWFYVGFSPRKQSMSVYIMDGFKKYDTLLKKLGKHKTGKSCLYINKLSDVDEKVLRALITESVRHIKAKHGIA